MSTTNSKLELFALKSYVSVLPETEKETALKIVGGDDPPPNPWDDIPDGYLPNIYNPDDRWFFDAWYDWMEGQGYNDPFLWIDNDGYNIWSGHDGCPDGSLIGPNGLPIDCMDREGWEDFCKEYYQ